MRMIKFSAFAPRLTLLALVPVAVLDPGPRAPVPSRAAAKASRSEPAAVYAALIETHSLIAIGESHQLLQEHRFLHELIRDPRIHGAIDDIVVEFGNALYQGELDAYILGDNDADVSSIAHVWRNTTQIHGVWDSPLYREFFAFVRSLNATLEPKTRVRVVAGDFPIDWDTVAESAEVQSAYAERASYYAEAALREVVEPGRRALLLIGGSHLRRSAVGSVAQRIEAAVPGAIHISQPIVREETYAIWRASYPHVSSPALTLIAGTSLDRQTSRLVIPTGAEAPIRDVADSLLFVGAPNGHSYVAPHADHDIDEAYCRIFRQRIDRWMPESLRGSVRHPCVAG